MKPCIQFLVLIVSAVLVMGCNRESPGNAASSTNVVVFREARVSVDVGPGWKRLYYTPGPGFCTPTLSCSNGVVGASLPLSPDTTVQEGITGDRRVFELHTNSVKDSWHQVGFTSANGVTGQHTSYIETMTNHANQKQRQLHNFLFQGKDGKLVMVNYMGPAGDQAEAIEQMIERSLKLE